MAIDVDVAVVGGGPSGAATAHYLASRGHSVLVCEKKSFPREKTCGDGLTPRAVKVLKEMGLTSEVESWERVEGLRVHAAGRVLELKFPELNDFDDYGLVKPRKDLDQIVLDNAEAAGAKVLYETQVKEPIFDRGVLVGFQRQTAGTTTKTSMLSGWCVPKGPQPSSHGHSVKPATSRTRWALRSASTSLHRWSTPVGSRPTSTSAPDPTRFPATGGCSRSVMAPSMRASGCSRPTAAGATSTSTTSRMDFIAQLPKEWEVNQETVVTRPRAGRLFMGASVWPPHGPGFLMVGDAAGMINPCNGEGIAYGYETGRIAGRHIDEALRSGTSPILAGLLRELQEVYGPYYRLGRRFVKLIGYPALMERLVSMGMRSKTVMSFALTLLANLEDSKTKNAEQSGLKVLKKMAEMKP